MCSWKWGRDSNVHFNFSYIKELKKIKWVLGAFYGDYSSDGVTLFQNSYILPRTYKNLHCKKEPDQSSGWPDPLLQTDRYHVTFI